MEFKINKIYRNDSENDEIVYSKQGEIREVWRTYALITFRVIETYANDMLEHQGYLYLNDVINMLNAYMDNVMGDDKAAEGVGWFYDEENPIGDNYVDFGIYNERNRDFFKGLSDELVLDFNVDDAL